MRNLNFVILKSFLLLLITAVSFLPVVYPIDRISCYFISAGLSVLYFFIGMREVIASDKMERKELQRFRYLPFLLISKRIIRISFFLILASLLVFPEVKLFWLQPLVISMAIGELIFFLTAVKYKVFSIRFYPDHLYMKQEKEMKIFAEEIDHIEYRYDIFYLVLKNRGTVKIDPEFTGPQERSVLVKTFLEWSRSNSIPFTEEAKDKLNKL
jgi:hypothetical protein